MTVISNCWQLSFMMVFSSSLDRIDQHLSQNVSLKITFEPTPELKCLPEDYLQRRISDRILEDHIILTDPNSPAKGWSDMMVATDISVNIVLFTYSFISNCQSFQLSWTVKLFLYLTKIIERLQRFIAPNRYTMKILMKNPIILIWYHEC